MNRAMKRERLRRVRRASIAFPRGKVGPRMRRMLEQRLRDAWRYGEDPKACWWQRVPERFTKRRS